MDSQSPSFELHTLPKWNKKRFLLSAEGLQVEGQAWIPFLTIREVNLSYGMASEYDVSHYLCRIWTHDGKKLAIRANEGDLAQIAPYHDFVQALHAGLLPMQSQVRFTTGMRSKWMYGILMGFFGILFLGLIAAVIFGMFIKGKIVMGILVILGILVGGGFIYKMMRAFAKPGHYDPGKISGRLLPLP